MLSKCVFLLAGLIFACYSLLYTEFTNKDILKAVLPESPCIIAGTSKGLYFWDYKNEPVLLWNGGDNGIEIRKIITVPYGIFLLTSSGIVFSGDTVNYNFLNNGLNIKVMKYYRDSVKSFSYIIQDLKDLKVDPMNPSNLITCSKDGVFYTTSAGNKWTFLPNPSIASGIKSAVIYTDQGINIMIAHPFKGIYYRNINKMNGWHELNNGILELTGFYEEVSDLYSVRNGDKPVIFAANNFSPNIYRFNQKENSWDNILRMKDNFNLIESLYFSKNLYFICTNGLMELELNSNEDISKISGSSMSASFSSELGNGSSMAETSGKGSSVMELNQLDISKFRNSIEEKTGSRLQCFCSFTNGETEFNLSGLWLFAEPERNSFTQTADGKRGLYVQPGVIKQKQKYENILTMLSNTGLNSLVIDMKDDWGNLKFNPESVLLKRMGRVQNPVDVEDFSKALKKKNIYLIARLVLFQDRVLYSYNSGEMAVKSASTGKPWQGIKKNKDGTTKLIKEYWVDPYSEKVWEYNVEIAKELISKGFNEVQFDYVRFPTDGENLGDAYYPSRDRGMDKESAIMSFLNYARENIDAPISIDIYGANGWWRTGARTGQDVEMFKRYVNVICPMYYPSHFAPEFMNFKPFELKTYRIYYYGCLRNYYLGMKDLIIRPYVQAFKMNISYDRTYFGSNYIKNEVRGVQDSINMGYTFWNMGMNYQILNQVFN